MLSDEKMDRKIREHVKEHPVILPEDYQAMVQEQIKKCCEGEMHMNKKKQRKQIKTTLQYKKNHTSHAEKCCFLLTLGNQKGIIKSDYKNSLFRRRKWDTQIICLRK